MLITRAGLRPGEAVLVHAAGSGVGSAAIQVAKFAGARVVTTAATAAKLAAGKRLGADAGINYTEEDVAERARALTDGRGVDVVVEHIGPQTWRQSLGAMAKGGRLVTCGATSGPMVEMDLRAFFTREISVIGCYMGGRAELDRVLGLVAQGRLKPVVDSVLPLKDAARAQARMESRRQFGKIVLKP
jgi:NADPH:quinone reductase-like Zn-dependent oxidoreductase